MIDVIEPGFATTVQDEGRPGFYKQGIAPSGAMDLLSYRVGSALVGNPDGSAGLEITFTGPRLRFLSNTVFAVTGGELPVFLNGEEVGTWESHTARVDDVLSFGFLKSGVRAYISVQGGIGVPEVLGSRSTHVLVQIGGYEGRKLQAGDSLPLGDPPVNSAQVKKRILLETLRPVFSKDVELRYIPGLFDYRLTEEGLRCFADLAWKVTPNADRTGIRLTANRTEPLEFVDRPAPFGAGSDPSNVVDAGYPIGAIQIPSGVEPIVLARDAVTAGGYFTVGAVITADQDALGQSPTHGNVKFVPVSVETALDARRHRREKLADALDSLG